MNAIGTKNLLTKRLILRKVCASDARELFEAGILGGSPEEAESIVENMMKYNDDPYNFHWVLEYNGRAVGRVKAWEISDRDDHTQLGYDIGRNYRCMGLMTEAIREVTRYLMGEAGFNRVYCMIRETNIPSIRVCEKVGMTYEGTMRKHYKQPDGSYVDVRVYGILAADLLH